jgi:hypothetical protein
VYWEDSLDSNTVGNLAHRKRGAIAAPVDPDDNPFERLNALLFALTNLNLEAHGIADAKCREIGTQNAVFELLNDTIHENIRTR